MPQKNTGKRGQPRRLKNGVDHRFLYDVPPPPDYFDEETADIWSETAAILIDRRDLSEADLGTLEVYACNVTLFRQATREIAREGSTYVRDSGNPAVHPAVQVRRGAEMQIATTSSQLGLNVNARKKLAPHQDDDDTSGAAGGAF